MLATISIWECPQLVLLGLFGLSFIVEQMAIGQSILTFHTPDGKLPLDAYVAVYLWLVMSGAAAAIAHGKQRDGIGYFGLSLLISPLAGIVLAWALPPLGKSPTTSG